MKSEKHTFLIPRDSQYALKKGAVEYIFTVRGIPMTAFSKCDPFLLQDKIKPGFFSITGGEKERKASLFETC